MGGIEERRGSKRRRGRCEKGKKREKEEGGSQKEG